MFSAQSAVELIARHDIVLDCTDNVLTRYLISDAAVLNGVQVVSGAGQGLEGQLVVLHKDLSKDGHASGYATRRGKSRGKRGPCYRCLFPKAPRPEDVTDCEDGGVLGGVTGIVGTLQAVEAIKLLTGMSDEGEGTLLVVHLGAEIHCPSTLPNQTCPQRNRHVSR
jgi:molybdopterin/thiamine biosynthesis adenylyltransferase